MLKALHYHIVSLICHVVIVVLLYIISNLAFNIFSEGEPSKNVNKLRVVGKAIKVDIVAMPKLTIQELKNFSPAPGKSNLPSKIKNKESGGDKNTVLKKHVKKLSFAERMKELAKRNVKKSKRKKKDRIEEKSGADGLSGKNIKKILALGNKLQEGTSYTGGAGENSGDLFDTYSLTLMESIRKYWKLPGYLLGKEYRCQIRVFIGKNGKLLRMEKILSSGNIEYDQRAMEAIRKVGNFKSPSKEILSRLSAGEIVLAFPL